MHDFYDIYFKLASGTLCIYFKPFVGLFQSGGSWKSEYQINRVICMKRKSRQCSSGDWGGRQALWHILDGPN